MAQKIRNRPLKHAASKTRGEALRGRANPRKGLPNVRLAAQPLRVKKIQPLPPDLKTLPRECLTFSVPPHSKINVRRTETITGDICCDCRCLLAIDENHKHRFNETARRFARKLRLICSDCFNDYAESRKN